MWGLKQIKRSLAALLSLALVVGTSAPGKVYAASGDGIEVPEITHGTADTWISEEMVNNTPPADYKVNKDVQADARDGLYNAYFLKDELQTVSIEIEENNLNYLLQNAVAEPYVMTTSVTIGDTTLGYCGLKTKGAYTLEHSYTDNAGSDRFSFTVNFGKFIKKKDYGSKQNFYGANKISFNNFFFDKSMMKEFFALKLMDEMGLPTPQYGLAKLYINGRYYGVYAMVEAMDESILEQYYGVDDDELSSYLCKPEGTSFLYEELLADDSPLWENDEDTKADVEDMLPTVMEWVRKLNCLSQKTDFDGNTIDVNSETYLELLAQVMDVDEVVKYFAVHSWLCQMDNMFDGKKNFGLYVDAEGKCLIVPWDYDLAFGCFYPCSAENTANYDLDIMYKYDYWGGSPGAQSAQTYKNYPLFNVIYQNSALMEQYHGYMKDCSKIAALGGTAEATGVTYEPGYFNSFIETMEEDMIAAATEKLADNVYYMNYTRQPNDVKKALPNFSKIIALRAVGVYVQTENINTTVAAYGCDLTTLGNAIKGEYAYSGLLTAVDASTGIFASSFYTGKRAEGIPMLKVSRVEETDEMYPTLMQQTGCDENDTVIFYAMSNTKKPQRDYTLNIPLSGDFLAKEGVLEFYSYTKAGELTALEMTADDNLYSGKTASIDYIAVVKKVDNPVTAEPTAEPTTPTQEATVTDGNAAKEVPDSNSTTVLFIVLCGVFVVIVAGLAMVGKKRK